MTKTQPLPVTVISGFLGAGKTTLLSHILNNKHGLRAAVLVNDMAEVNIDANLIRGGKSVLSKSFDGLVELHNGCICCTLREEFAAHVAELAHLGRFDHLLVEATGVSEPMPVTMAFDLIDPNGVLLGDLAPLDTLVTVVDAFNFLSDWDEAAELKRIGAALDDEDHRTLADLLAEQVEFANVVVVNKTDLVSKHELSRLFSILRRLNPEARILDTMYGVVPLDAVLGTGEYDKLQGNTPIVWQATRERFKRTTTEANEFGVSSFVYRARRPFHPQRLWDVFHDEWPGVLRSKGVFWLASRMSDFGIWSQAGPACSHSLGGSWWAAIPKLEWPEDDAVREAISAEFRGPYGDRRQELVVIGIDVDETDIRRRLDACLLDESEMQLGPMGWLQLNDPFPSWDQHSDEEPALISFSRRPVPMA